ncbi:unnamed protein product [Periconia digitata]|uniref:Uncharacterized protein n=1 Tax=Periconia digitata TaxID=1303443 RepID=A0A9W4UFT3_9PLEO|nr:unnamed protein product [Periconia digitata]
MAAPYEDKIVTVFDGALTICWKRHPKRDFAFEATFQLDHPALAKFRSGKPPLHFHPHQEEYIKVTEGSLAVEFEGQEHVLTSEDGEFLVKPWAIHRLYTLPPSAQGEDSSTHGNRVSFQASGERTEEMYKMDYLFFENWYGYQDEMIRDRKSISLIQTMSMFDAGGSYIVLPWWVPFRRRTSQILGILIGRCLGGLLGYRPFYRKWSTDWSLAQSKMRTSIFHWHFAGRDKLE